jgi:hypothetical protein
LICIDVTEQGYEMQDAISTAAVGAVRHPYVLKGRSSVPGLPMVHQRQWR